MGRKKENKVHVNKYAGAGKGSKERRRKGKNLSVAVNNSANRYEESAHFSAQRINDSEGVEIIYINSSSDFTAIKCLPYFPATREIGKVSYSDGKTCDSPDSFDDLIKSRNSFKQSKLRGEVSEIMGLIKLIGDGNL